MKRQISHPVDKLAMAEELSEMRKMFGKGLVLKHSLEKGAILGKGDLTSKKPAAGIPADQLDRVIGKRINRSIQSGDFLQAEDIDE